MEDESLKNILKGNALEYYKNAAEAEQREEYNTSATLFFKALSSLGDLFVLINKKRIPKNHTERFEILRIIDPGLYNIFDKAFPLYQESYKAKLGKEVSLLLREYAEQLFKLLGISF
jgi:hypothetical protein